MRRDARDSREELKTRLVELERTLSQYDAAQKETKRGDALAEKRRLEVAQVTLHSDKIIELRDVKNLMLSMMGEGKYIPWATIQSKELIKTCVMIHVPGIDVQLWEEHKGVALNALHRSMGDPVTTVVNQPTTTAVQSTTMHLNAHVKQKSKHRKEIQNKDRPKKRQKKGTSKQCSFEDLVASKELLADFGYPLSSKPEEQHKGFITAPLEAEEHHQLVALDCEMCETARGSELTRMSLVDCEGKVLADTLVKPHLPITDYRTKFSGITPALLDNVTVDLAQAQAMFCRFVSADTIVVGHSLENDLIAMEIFHDRVIDTTMIYPHPAGFPRRTSLKHLAKDYLGKAIQDGAHDSITDATIALELTKLKKEEGLEFGIPRCAPTQFRKVTSLLSEWERVCCMIDRNEVISRHSAQATHVIPCTSDAVVTQKLISQLNKDHHFIWAQFQDLYRFYIVRNAEEATKPESENKVNGHLTEISKSLKQVYDAAPVNTLIMICTSHGDTSLAIKTQSTKARREAGIDKEAWTPSDEENWAALMHRVVQGLFFAKVKTTTH